MSDYSSYHRYAVSSGRQSVSCDKSCTDHAGKSDADTLVWFSAIGKEALGISRPFFQKSAQLGTNWKADLRESTLNLQPT